MRNKKRRLISDQLGGRPGYETSITKAIIPYLALERNLKDEDGLHLFPVSRGEGEEHGAGQAVLPHG